MPTILSSAHSGYTIDISNTSLFVQKSNVHSVAGLLYLAFVYRKLTAHRSKIFHNRNQFIIGSYAMVETHPSLKCDGTTTTTTPTTTTTTIRTTKKAKQSEEEEKQCQENEITFARLIRARISFSSEYLLV